MKHMDHKYDCACYSHVGNKRPKNEDNFLFFNNYMPEQHLTLETPIAVAVSESKRIELAVFDGMGGESAGEVASYTAARALEKIVSDNNSLEVDYTDILYKLNDAVLGAADERKIVSMGSTAVLLEVSGETVTVASMGDSAAFMVRDRQIARINRIHSNKGGLTQFLGMDIEEYGFDPYVAEYDMKANDCFLLCTDGLTDMVTTERIEEIVCRSRTAVAVTKGLVEEALRNGGEDNITVVAVMVRREWGIRDFLDRISGRR